MVKIIQIVDDILGAISTDIRETGNQQLKSFQDILLWLELERKLYEKERLNAPKIKGILYVILLSAAEQMRVIIKYKLYLTMSN